MPDLNYLASTLVPDGFARAAQAFVVAVHGHDAKSICFTF
jgi:hypothetical protein